MLYVHYKLILCVWIQDIFWDFKILKNTNDICMLIQNLLKLLKIFYKSISDVLKSFH